MRSCSLRQPLTTRLALQMIGTMLLASSTGCSFIFVHRHDVPPESPPDCTRSLVAPALDAAVTIAAPTYYFIATAGCAPGHCEAAPLSGALLLYPAIVTGASAIYGFVKTSNCRAQWSDWCASHHCDQYGRPLPPSTGDAVAAAAGLRPADIAASAASMPRVNRQPFPAVSRSSP